MHHTLLSALALAMAVCGQDPQKGGANTPAPQAQQNATQQNSTQPTPNAGAAQGRTPRGATSQQTFNFSPLGRPDSSSPLSLSAVTQIQAELNLTAEQKQALADLRKKLDERERSLFADAQKLARDAQQDASRAVTGLLDPKQVARLDQLRLQRIGITALTFPDVAQKLGLTEEQLTKLKTLDGELRQASQFGRGGDRGTAGGGDVAPRTAENRQRITQDMVGVLTAEQKTKWDELIGAKFEFPSPVRSTGSDPRGSTNAPPNLTTRFRSRDFEFGQITPPPVRPTSMRMVQDLYGPVGPFRYKSIVDALALTDDQANQIRAIGAADVEAIKKIGDRPTPDDSAKITQINNETREKLDKVVTDEQKKKLKELTAQ